MPVGVCMFNALSSSMLKVVSQEVYEYWEFFVEAEKHDVCELLSYARLLTRSL